MQGNFKFQACVGYIASFRPTGLHRQILSQKEKSLWKKIFVIYE
jgi:hypothetical protein